MKASIRLGRLFGIEIGIHYSWLAILLLLTWSLSTSYYPTVYPEWSNGLHWLLGFSSSLLLFASVLAHELGHSLVAQRRGIPVKSITLFLFGGAANISKEAETPPAELFMALSGPAVSFALGGIFWALYYFTYDSAELVSAISLYLSQVNLILGIFNMVPGFPLDGGRVFRALIWWKTGDFRQATRIASTTGKWFAYLLILSGLVITLVYGIFSGLWLALIGWFLANAASAGYRQVIIGDILKGGRVSEIMSTTFPSVTPEMSLQQATQDYVIHFTQSALPVIKDNKLMGIITLKDMKKVPREQWPNISAGEVMTGIEKLKTVSPEENLETLARLMESNDWDMLPVMLGGNLFGMVSKHSIARYAHVRQNYGNTGKA